MQAAACHRNASLFGRACAPVFTCMQVNKLQVAPSVPQCITPACSRKTWDGNAGGTCCRTCADSNGMYHGAVCEKKSAAA